jgi:hypothetical protein
LNCRNWYDEYLHWKRLQDFASIDQTIADQNLIKAFITWGRKSSACGRSVLSIRCRSCFQRSRYDLMKKEYNKLFKKENQRRLYEKGKCLIPRTSYQDFNKFNKIRWIEKKSKCQYQTLQTVYNNTISENLLIRQKFEHFKVFRCHFVKLQNDTKIMRNDKIFKLIMRQKFSCKGVAI